MSSFNSPSSQSAFQLPVSEVQTGRLSNAIWRFLTPMSEAAPLPRLTLFGQDSPQSFLVVSLALADGGAALPPRRRLLAPLVEERVAGCVEVLDLHLVVVHAHGRQGAGHLLLRETRRKA